MQHLPSQGVSRKASNLHYASLFVLLMLAAFSIFPPFQAMENFKNILLILIITWYSLTLIDSPKFLFQPSFFTYATFFFIIFTVTVPYIYDNPKIGNRFFEISQVFLFYLAYLKNIYVGRTKDNIFIVKLFSLFFIVVSIVTTYALILNPLSSRGGGSIFIEGIKNSLKLVGGYSFIYCLVIVFAISITVYHYSRYLLPIKSRILLFFLSSLFLVNIILSNFTIALLLIILSVLMVYTIRKLNMFFLIIYAIISVSIIVISFQYIGSFLDSISNLFGDTLNALRMTELKNFILSNEEGIAIEARSSVYENSITVFLQNPLNGTISKNLMLKYGVVGFGQHSQILDCFALFGFFIGTLQLYLYSTPFIIRMRTKNTILKKISFIVLIIFILLITFNNITASIGFAAFFIFPTIYDWIAEKLNSYKKTNNEQISRAINNKSLLKT